MFFKADKALDYLLKWPYAVVVDGSRWCHLAERTCTEAGGCKSCTLWEQAQGGTIVEDDDGEAS